jgi:preprotein translocase subunit SecA
MAGRGTDIVLGGSLDEDIALAGSTDPAAVDALRQEWQRRHAQVVDAGGLHVIGSERHESRRVDNQLRGRSGRQGDPGSTRFYLALEDPLMRIFASERVAALMQRLGMQEGEAIEHPWVTRAIENAQRKVEARNFDIRKQLLEYDNVANDQRKVIYHMRDDLMEAEDISTTVADMRADFVKSLIDQYIPPMTMEEQWNVKGLEDALERELGAQVPIAVWLDDDPNLHEEKLRDRIVDRLGELYDRKVEAIGPSIMHHFEKSVLLQVLDNSWKEHLAAMDHLRQGIHLRGYAQKDPKQEYKREAFEMFTSMLDSIKAEFVSIVSRVQVRSEDEIKVMEEQSQAPVENMQYQHAEINALDDEGEDQPEETKLPESKPFVRDERKVGRNEACPCGSGRKYKNCHGKLA